MRAALREIFLLMAMLLTPDVLDAALAPARIAVRWTRACTVLLAAGALGVAGVDAALAVGAGGILGIVGGRALLGGLASVFQRGNDDGMASRRAVVTALFRFPLLGAAIAACVMLLDLHPAWLALGLTTWPVALMGAALRDQSAPTATSPS